MMEYNVRGYLNDDFKVFYLADSSEIEVPFHYHDFMKILILISGNISYVIEGKQYELQPYDIVLVDAGEIHRPIINDQRTYERLIIYISPEFLEAFRPHELQRCFQESRRQQSHVVSCGSWQKELSQQMLMGLTEEACKDYYAYKLLQRSRLLEFLILLNDRVIKKGVKYLTPISQNEMVLQAIEYMNTHFTEPLSIDKIAKAVHVHRSYLMHRFKAETGYTIKEYLTDKRLFTARKYLQEQMPATEASFASGFSSYASFYRAYIEKYGCSPKQGKYEINL